MTSDPVRPFGRVHSAKVNPCPEDRAGDLAGAPEQAPHLLERGAHDGHGGSAEESSPGD